LKNTNHPCKYGAYMTREQLEAYIQENYNSDPEHPWAPESDHTVFRHTNNRKWFAVVMEISKSKLGIKEDGMICIVNLKCDPMMLGSFLCEEGIFPAWHMSKNHWLSAAAENDDERLKFLINESFNLTARKRPTRHRENGED